MTRHLGRERAPIEQPGIEVGTCRERNTGQRTSKRIKTQFPRQWPRQHAASDHAGAAVSPGSTLATCADRTASVRNTRASTKDVPPAVASIVPHQVPLKRGTGHTSGPARAMLLLRANTQSEHTVSKETHILLTIQETVGHITLPVPAYETRPPSLGCHGICGIVNETIDHILEHKQRRQSWQQTQESCFIGLPPAGELANWFLQMPCQQMQARITQVVEPLPRSRRFRQDAFDQPFRFQCLHMAIDRGVTGPPGHTHYRSSARCKG